MKIVIAIQRVKVPSSQSLANRLVENPVGNPRLPGDGNRRAEPGETRVQAV